MTAKYAFQLRVICDTCGDVGPMNWFPWVDCSSVRMVTMPNLPEGWLWDMTKDPESTVICPDCSKKRRERKQDEKPLRADEV